MTPPIRSLTHVLPLVAVVALAVIVVALASSPASAAPGGYHYQQVGELPQPAPGIPGKYLVRDFEINGLNQGGGLLYGADYHSSGFLCQLGTGNCPGAEGEGLWAQKRNGAANLILWSGGTDPDGEDLGPAYYGPASSNNSGDAAVAWPLDPPPSVPGPGGQQARLHAGVYRYDAATGSVSVIAKTGSPAPGGGTFAGASSTTSINSSGNVAFLGIAENPNGTFAYNSTKYGVGVYLADNQNSIEAVAVPGDAAPEGGTFDLARNPNVNDAGDVAFDARLSSGPACSNFTCLTRGAYVRWAESGTVERLAGVGDVAPIPPLGSVAYTDYVYGPYINNQGQVIFTGGVPDPFALPAPALAAPVTRALFFAEDGVITPIVYPGLSVITTDGDVFTFWRISFTAYNTTIGNDGKVAFLAQSTTDNNGDGVRDSAVFVWDDGEYTLLAKSGDALPGIGTVREICSPACIAGNSASRPGGGLQLNSRGQVAFHVVLEAMPPHPMQIGKGVLVVASPAN